MILAHLFIFTRLCLRVSSQYRRTDRQTDRRIRQARQARPGVTIADLPVKPNPGLKCRLLVESRTRTFDRCQKQRPLMILNGHYAPICEK